MNVYFFNLSSLFYLLGTLAYLSHIIFLKDLLSRMATLIVSIGFTSHSLAILTRYVEAG
jgi:hypothetical protein